ncbi:hypothetical protein DLM75_05135 [Leptospira stimsonii]|uniref:Uncharacterized protein n=1 Tax=Leptospira stimsonii TaxID=2202203 RepID=A0A396ZF89_9LEPT|nr:hypothetical protein DLM75_05135 [Leptospira stimsonii]
MKNRICQSGCFESIFLDSGDFIRFAREDFFDSVKSSGETLNFFCDSVFLGKSRVGGELLRTVKV